MIDKTESVCVFIYAIIRVCFSFSC